MLEINLFALRPRYDEKADALTFDLQYGRPCKVEPFAFDDAYTCIFHGLRVECLFSKKLQTYVPFRVTVPNASTFSVKKFTMEQWPPFSFYAPNTGQQVFTLAAVVHRFLKDHVQK